MADIDLKTETPDTSLPTTGFLFGADSQAAASPSVYTVQSVATTLLGSTALSGATVTADAPVLNLSQTWNDAAVTFTGLKFNATSTASASGSRLLDIQVGSASTFQVLASSALSAAYTRVMGGGQNLVGLGSLNAGIPQVVIQNTGSYGWSVNADAFSGSYDLFLTRRAAANLRLGAADAAAPVAQTLSVQSVAAGNTNVAGANLTITGSQGTGTGAGGSIVFQVAPAGASGTAQNALSTALTIDSARRIEFAQATGSTAPNIGVSGSTTSGFGSTNGFDFFYTRAGSPSIQFGSAGLAVSSTLAIGFAFGSATGTSLDTILARDAANTLALRNGTNPNLFRVYSSYNGTNDAYGAIGAAINLDGTAGDANTLYIGSQKKGSPTALTKLALQVDGTTRLDYNITASNVFAFKANVRLIAGLQLYFSGINANNNIGSINGAYFTFQSASAVTLGDWALTGNVVLQFGGTTSSFPALKRSSASLIVRLADDSGDADLAAKALTLSGDLTISTKNIVTDTTTGTQIATATDQKIGFFGATPVVQGAEITDELTTITFTAPGTPDYAISNLVDSAGGSAFGFASADEGNSVLAVIANLQARVNDLESRLVTYGLLADAD